jgi:hypothetical protein
MTLTGVEFGLFDEECLACAREATTDERRSHYLDMAKMWTTEANRLESATAVRSCSEQVNGRILHRKRKPRPL